MRTFCFSSDDMELLCSRDVVNQKCFKMFHWFSKPFASYWPWKYQILIYLCDRDAKKTSTFNARLIYYIHKNNNKNNNKNHDRIAKAFAKFLLSEIILSIEQLKYFFCTHLTILFPLTYSNFLDSNNPSILWSLRLLLPKSSSFYCFKICRKIAREFKTLAILYFYRFIIIFNLTLQVLLVIVLNEVRSFCQQMSDFSIPFAFENI